MAHRPTFAARTTLVLGGARSGKSAYGEDLVLASGLEPVYIATAAAGDEEMRRRIAEHRRRRGGAWATFEEQLDLPASIVREARADRMLLVDCLTLWLSNLMLQDRDVTTATRLLCARLAETAGPVVMISNEVGLGLVPETRLGRDFRDAQGRLNQAVAGTCDRVVFVAAGLPMVLKPNYTQEYTA